MSNKNFAPPRLCVRSSPINSFENAVGAALENCPPDTAFLASVSGGADSTAMLAALAAVRDRGKSFNLSCLHVEHGIRPAPESCGDAEFVRSLCKTLAIPCRIVHIPPGKVAETAKKFGIGIEAAARFYRRRAWFKTARGIESRLNAGVRILTAHTADDMLETALMRILRGAGPSGLAAMPAARGRILRPLLALSRSDVIAYLLEKNLSWREDSTNADLRFFRNRVRHRLFPLLDADFPGWRTALASFAQTQSRAAGFISGEAASRINWQGGVPFFTDTDTENFFAQPSIVREEALFQGIDRLLSSARVSVPPRTVKRKNIRRFSEGAVNAADLGPVRIEKNSQQIILSLAAKSDDIETFPGYETGFSLLINAPGLYNVKGIAIEARENQSGGGGGGDVFVSLFPLAIKPFYKGDSIANAARGGKNSGLKPQFTAVDTLGVAAFIGAGGLIQCRDEKETLTAAGKRWAVKITTGLSVNGSTDVKRTE